MHTITTDSRSHSGVLNRKQDATLPWLQNLASSSGDVRQKLNQLSSLSLLKLIEVTAVGAEESVGLRF